MMVDTTIYAYAFSEDGFVSCASCVSDGLEDGPYTRDRGATFHDGSHDHGPSCEDGTGHCERTRGHEVFSHEDDGYGLTCDDCYEPIFEVWPEVDHTEYGNHAEFLPDEAREADCANCQDWLATHSEHANDAHNLGADQFEDDCDTCADTVYECEQEHDAGEHSITTGQPRIDCPFCPKSWWKVVR